MRRLIGTALILGFALVWRPDAAAGQYSWSDFSFSLGVGTHGVGLRVGLSYSSVGSWYDIEYHDPCWDYTYYDWYAYPCRYSYYDPSYHSYYDPGYYDDWGYYGDYHGRRSVRLSYGYLPWHHYYPYYPAYWGYGWGYGHWGGGIHLSFGSLYPYNWFDYGYGSGYYGSHYRGRVLPTYVGVRPRVLPGRYGGAGSALYGSGLGYKESPRATPVRRAADNRAGTTAPSARTAARRAATTTAARSPQRRATAGRVQAPTTRASATRAAGAQRTVPRARPSDALQGRTNARSSAASRARAPGMRGRGRLVRHLREPRLLAARRAGALAGALLPGRRRLVRRPPEALPRGGAPRAGPEARCGVPEAAGSYGPTTPPALITDPARVRAYPGGHSRGRLTSQRAGREGLESEKRRSDREW